MRKGKIIVFEGIDGSGKSTQTVRLASYFTSIGRPVIISNWLSGQFTNSFLKKLNEHPEPNTYVVGSYIIAMDMANRFERDILPAIDAGVDVICDRYYYTSIVRDTLRGVPEELVRRIYDFLPKEPLTLYFHTPADISFMRKSDKGISIFETGLDVFEEERIDRVIKKYKEGGYSRDVIKDSYVKFQTLIQNAYQSLPEYRNFIRIDSTKDVDSISSQIIQAVTDKI